MTDSSVHNDGFSKDDPRNEMFPDLGPSPWLANERGYKNMKLLNLVRTVVVR
jgi:hypothetical protein